MFLNLDSLLLSQPRLSIMSILKMNREAEFMTIKDNTGMTAGNLSTQIQKLRDAGYLEIVKQFKGNYPHTMCRLTEKGEMALEEFFTAIHSYEKMHLASMQGFLN